MPPSVLAKILQLCDRVDEVLQNGDWPTDDGTWTDDGTTCSCPMNDLITDIREALGGV